MLYLRIFCSKYYNLKTCPCSYVIRTPLAFIINFSREKFVSVYYLLSKMSESTVKNCTKVQTLEDLCFINIGKVQTNIARDVCVLCEGVMCIQRFGRS